MKIKTKSFTFTGLLAGLCLLTSQVHAADIIYRDDFSGAGALNGTTPDVTPSGESWVSSGLFNADGTKPANGNGGAFLPFSPQPGHVYRISADLNPNISGSSDWFALGFSEGATISNPFYSGTNRGAAWGLVRENDAGGMVQTFLGPVTAFAQAYDPNPDLVGPVRLAVELNTFQANWTATWYLNGQLIRNNLNVFSPNPTINYVGFGALNQANGSIDNFLLAEIGKPVPEPSTSMIVLVGAAVLSFRRRLSREATARKRAA